MMVASMKNERANAALGMFPKAELWADSARSPALCGGRHLQSPGSRSGTCPFFQSQAGFVDLVSKTGYQKASVRIWGGGRGFRKEAFMGRMVSHGKWSEAQFP